MTTQTLTANRKSIISSILTAFTHSDLKPIMQMMVDRVGEFYTIEEMVIHVLNDYKNINGQFSLVEDNTVHTSGLNMTDAIEMRNRHANCFPGSQYKILPDSAVTHLERGESIAERHMRIARKY